MEMVARLGFWISDLFTQFGQFVRFCGLTFAWIPQTIAQRRYGRTIVDQFFEIGARSVPVVMVTGLFIGAVLAVQTAPQFKALGMIDKMAAVVNLSVLRELGPVLAGVMLAGRVGGGLTAELGTMRVTEQIEALRAMGADPIRVLVVPRFLACLLLIPLLAVYASAMGIFGGYIISVELYHANGADFWANAANTVQMYDIFYGPIKCLFFGAAMSLICCYKGFHCRPGAAGVGQACTQSFVASCMTILALDLFLGMVLNTCIELFWGLRTLIG